IDALDASEISQRRRVDVSRHHTVAGLRQRLGRSPAYALRCGGDQCGAFSGRAHQELSHAEIVYDPSIDGFAAPENTARQLSATTGVVSVPTPSTQMSTMSPGRTGPTPDGVP